MLSSLEDFGMVSPNIFVAFSQNKICALHLPDDPANHNLQRFWHRNFIVGAWEDAKVVVANPYVYEDTSPIAFTLRVQLHTLRIPLDKIATQLGPVEPCIISSQVNVVDRMENCIISALGLYALFAERGMCTMELHGKMQPSLVPPTAESAWEHFEILLSRHSLCLSVRKPRQSRRTSFSMSGPAESWCQCLLWVRDNLRICLTLLPLIFWLLIYCSLRSIDTSTRLTNRVTEQPHLRQSVECREIMSEC
jgi:hypothetical protein